MPPEIPSNAEKEAFASEVNTTKTTIKDCESYIKSLNEEIRIDEGRAAAAQARGLLGDYVGYLMRSKDRRRLVQSYETQKRAATQDLAIVKEQWYKKYGFPLEVDALLNLSNQVSYSYPLMIGDTSNI